MGTAFSILALLCLLLTWQYTLLDPLCLILEWLGVTVPAEGFPGLYDLLERFMDVSTQGVILLLLAAGVFFLIRRLRCSKTVCLVLWCATALRLLLPVQLPSHFSVFNAEALSDRQSIIQWDLTHESAGEMQYPISAPVGNDGVLPDATAPTPDSSPNSNSAFRETPTVEDPSSASREAQYGGAIALIWCGGIALTLGYSVVSYLLLRRRLRFAVKDDTLRGVWYSDRISTPCVVGFLRPQIYLTFGLSEQEKTHILAHERQHIKNGDHIWKALAWFVMCLHWLTIHPLLLLLVYQVFIRNLEEACDQRVLRELGEQNRADYGQSLLALSVGPCFHPGITPIAFGEGDTRGRVTSILRYKKPLAILSALVLVAAVLLGIALGTDPVEEDSVTPAVSADFTISQVIAQSTTSSIFNEDVLEKSAGTTVRLSEDRFAIDGVGFVEDMTILFPIYEVMELGDSLPTYISTDAAGSETVLLDLPLPAGTDGYRVLTNEGSDSGYRVFVLEDCIWLGKWVTHEGSGGSLGEYQYIFRADSGLSQDDSETVSDFESLTLSWTFPKEPGQYLGNAFPLTFCFDFDSYNVSSTGMAFLSQKDGISIAPITGASSSMLWWWPYPQGSDTPDTSGSMTLVFYQNEAEVFACSLLFQQTAETADTLTYSVRAIFHGYDGFLWIETPENGGGEIRPSACGAPETVATWFRDLTHDGVDEEIRVIADLDYACCYYVQVRTTTGKTIWRGSVGFIHAGQNGIYLYEEDGLSYLMEWNDYASSGMGSIWYHVFSLSETGDEWFTLAENTFELFQDDPLSTDLPTFEKIRDESIHYLSNSMVLVSSNGDTPEGKYYSTPDHVLTPTIKENYLFWWTEEQLRSIQERASGTYTFTAEVASVMEYAIMVADQSLYPEAELEYCFLVPVADPTIFSVGDLLEITADGYLYKYAYPAADTAISITKLNA